MNQNNSPEVAHWKYHYEKMKESSPLIIHYPLCGGGEECITACPFADKIWDVEEMLVSLFGINEKIRGRPVMVHPELCKKCNVCVQACPTGALRPVERPVRCPAITLVYNTLKLPFKKKYGIKFVFRKEHGEKFKKNN